MLVVMRLCAPRSRQPLLTTCLLGHKAPTSLLQINPSSCWNRTFATGTRKTDSGGLPKDQQKMKAADEVICIERVPKRVGNVKSGVTVVDKQQPVGVWSHEQICKLEELVAAHTIEPESLQRMIRRRTDWITIGRLLAVDPEEYKAQWKSIQDRGKKKVRFTAEEDALIVQRVTEWGDKGRGLWVSLEPEFGRDANAILIRYKTVIRLDRSSTRTYWTPAMDARLTEGVALYKENDGWAGVVEYMSGEVTALQCANRWSNHLSRAQQEGIKHGDWTDEEVRQLGEVVPQYVIKPYWSKQSKRMTKEYIDWTAIADNLKRFPMECTKKWESIQSSKMKKGPMTAEEDMLIRRRVAEWEREGKPKGLWVSLQKEVGRPATRIRMRWTAVLATRDLNWVPTEKLEVTPLLDRTTSRLKWTDPMDARLKEGVAKYKEKGGWMGVAKYVDDSVTAVQCQRRWTNHVSKVQKVGIRCGQWSDIEMRELRQLVPQHVIESQWSEKYKVMTKEHNDWTTIAVKLNRTPKDCKSVWLGHKFSMMKKGPFTAEEDALILKRVEEWGNKGNGLWVSLEKEMGRPGKTITSHWRNCLKRQGIKFK